VVPVGVTGNHPKVLNCWGCFVVAQNFDRSIGILPAYISFTEMFAGVTDLCTLDSPLNV